MSVHSLESPYMTYKVRRVIVMHVVGVLAVVEDQEELFKLHDWSPSATTNARSSLVSEISSSERSEVELCVSESWRSLYEDMVSKSSFSSSVAILGREFRCQWIDNRRWTEVVNSSNVARRHLYSSRSIRLCLDYFWLTFERLRHALLEAFAVLRIKVDENVLLEQQRPCDGGMWGSIKRGSIFAISEPTEEAEISLPDR